MLPSGVNRYFSCSALLPLALLIIGAFAGEARASSLTQQVAVEIASVLGSDGPPRLVLGREMLLNADLLPAFYRERGYAPAWFDDLGLSHAGLQLLDQLRSAGEEGLCPEDYHLGQIDPLVRLERDYPRFGVLFDPLYMARLDLLLTDAFLLYSGDLLVGRVDPLQVHEGWRARPRKLDLTRLLRQTLAGDRFPALVEDLAPAHQGYRLLLAELERHRRISALGGWPEIPAGFSIVAGDLDWRVPLLRQRLLITGDLSEGDVVDGDTLDDLTAAALVRFQLRHGLVGDGMLGARTLETLNLPVETRIRQIELNLERWRWLPKDLGERHILVNIADFRLSVVEREETVLSMPVVVGTSYRKTPVFSAWMKYLIFAPYWTVPATILREDKLPLIKADRGYLQRHHFEIVRMEGGRPVAIDPRSIDWRRVTPRTFPGILRQRPGEWNALGKVKFMFPNAFDVYLHDTPDQTLFDRETRTFSSGCIRIRRPAELAMYLLGKQGWERERIREAMSRSEPQRVDLVEGVPVHVLYWTAWVDESGILQFRDDIYLRDLDLERALRRW